jgi:hypothetical protein
MRFLIYLWLSCLLSDLLNYMTPPSSFSFLRLSTVRFWEKLPVCFLVDRVIGLLRCLWRGQEQSVRKWKCRYIKWLPSYFASNQSYAWDKHFEPGPKLAIVPSDSPRQKLGNSYVLTFIAFRGSSRRQGAMGFLIIGSRAFNHVTSKYHYDEVFSLRIMKSSQRLVVHRYECPSSSASTRPTWSDFI